MLGHGLDLLDSRQGLNYAVVTALREKWEIFLLA